MYLDYYYIYYYNCSIFGRIKFDIGVFVITVKLYLYYI